MSEYQAKGFGGRNMIVKYEQFAGEGVDDKSIEAAVQHLDVRRAPILVSHFGQNVHQRIVYDFSTGGVWVKRKPFDVNEV